MKSNNIIEINGKLYDAKSGQPLTDSAVHAVNHTASKSVDGFSRHSSNKITVASAVSTATPATAPKVRTQQRAAPHNVKRSVSRSTTLNRSGVKAPVTVTERSDHQSKPTAVSVVYSSATKHADTARFIRSQHVAKSSAIARFHSSNSKMQTETTATTPIAGTLTKHLENIHTLTTPILGSHTQSLSTKERLIKTAVGHAATDTAIKKPHAHKKTQFKLGKYATSGLVVLLLAGYVAYLNVPSISMKVAANRAGFAATMPSYKPAGYSLSGPIAYNPGQVTVNFQSNTDDRKFSLKQQPTTWDSTALLENFVTKQTNNYLTYQDRGLTIYIYDGSSAAWVNGGKLYNLQGSNSRLDTDQLLKLATSV